MGNNPSYGVKELNAIGKVSSEADGLIDLLLDAVQRQSDAFKDEKSAAMFSKLNFPLTEFPAQLGS